MKEEIVVELTKNFDDYSHKDENGIEFWYARDLQKLLGYAKWENFELVIKKAIVSCETSKHNASSHFPDVRKVVDKGGVAQQILKDYKLTRYACYLIAMNGDPRKEQIAFAQTYFAVQTRKMEIIQQRIGEHERLIARGKLTESEKILSGLIYERGVDGEGFGRIRSKGDEVLFGGYTTRNMKNKLNIKQTEPLADYLPTVTLKAKDLANEMTNYNLKNTDIRGEIEITNEHKSNNANVRQALTKSGIYPENLPAEENIKKVESKIKKEQKSLEKSEKIKQIKKS